MYAGIRTHMHASTCNDNTHMLHTHTCMHAYIHFIYTGGHTDVTWTFPCNKLFDNEEGVGKMELVCTY
jgi:hypothetical protein